MAQDQMFARLKEACHDDWRAYVEHPFVRQLGNGTLPKPCFQHYLKQDYLFLLHFARAYGLAVYKSGNLHDMRQAQGMLSAILDQEIDLHVRFCADWGIGEEELAALPEASATLGYTRYVLERGTSGNLLDLHAALAPCVVGYAEIGAWLIEQPDTKLEGNPYRAWIEEYADPAYQEVAKAEIDQLDRLSAEEPGPRRFDDLVKTFRETTRLEIAFWDMGLNLSE